MRPVFAHARKVSPVRTPVKLSLTALIAVMLLACAVSTASAGRLSINTQNIRTTWSRLEYRATITTRCQVTLEGSLHSRTILKTERSLIGAITRVDANACTGGAIRSLRLPWHLTYESFRGTLPDITALRVLLNRAQWGVIVEILGSRRTCLYGTATDNLSYELGLGNEGLATTLMVIEGRNVAHLLEGSTAGLTGCPGELRLIMAAEDGVTRILGTGAQIKIALI